MVPSAHLTPEQRTLRARIAAATRWGRIPTDQRRTASAPGRQAFLDRFLREVDAENPGLPATEREKLAASKLSAYMAGLALKSSRARSRARSRAPKEARAA